jgi:hypothetical protein
MNLASSGSIASKSMNLLSWLALQFFSLAARRQGDVHKKTSLMIRFEEANS